MTDPRPSEVQALAEQLREAERAAVEALTERDTLMERLDELAYAVAPMDVLGEHSTMNDPWTNALAYLNGEYEEFPGMAAVRGVRVAPSPTEDAGRWSRGGWHDGPCWREWINNPEGGCTCGR